MNQNRKTPPLWLLSIAVAVLGGWGAGAMNWPLAWLLGPLCTMVVIRCGLNWSLPDVPGGRRVGQWVIATSIGLHFTPSVVQQIADNALAVLVAAFLTLWVTPLGIWCLRRYGCDKRTAYFASLPGGASEMVNFALRYGARQDLVAATHSLRLVSIVLLVPPIFAEMSGTTKPLTMAVKIEPLAGIFLLGAMAAFLLRKWRLPNPWMFGPLICAGVWVALTGIEMGLPPWLGRLGQLLIGVSLGSFFDRDFLRSASRFLAWVMIFILGSVVLCAVAGWVVATVSNLSVAAVLLGMMPGGITELSLTAEALQLSVALVTAIQVARLAMVMTIAGPFYHFFLSKQ